MYRALQHSTMSLSRATRLVCQMSRSRYYSNLAHTIAATTELPEHIRPVFTGKPKPIEIIDNHTNSNTIQLRFGNESLRFDKLFLRDACCCNLCVDPSTLQKTFETTSIPPALYIKSARATSKGALEVIWDDNHRSIYAQTFLLQYANPTRCKEARKLLTPYITWDRDTIACKLRPFDYLDYMNFDRILSQVILQLHDYGIAVLDNCPTRTDSNESTIKLVERIGVFKHTFYGPTWNVINKHSNAKNVAYTALNLGLHMDLVHFDAPPGIQFLHCLQNEARGGDSIFADTFHTVHHLHKTNPFALSQLSEYPVAFHYNNDGHHMYNSRPTVVLDQAQPHDRPLRIDHVNYSPLFQAPFEHQIHGTDATFQNFLLAFRHFAESLNSEKSHARMRLTPGRCVIFQNRRIAHARTAFDANSGNRWLRGAYIDSEVFKVC